DQHRWTGLPVTDFLQDFQAVHIGQHQVEDYQIVIGGMNEFEGGGSIGSGTHRIAGALQSAAQEIGDPLFILDDQDTHLFSAYRRCGSQKESRGGGGRVRPGCARIAVIPKRWAIFWQALVGETRYRWTCASAAA